LSVFFFFSSRRRHTRFSRDWSSDVCSSDLPSSSTGEMMRSLTDLAETLELPVESTQDKAVPAVLEALRLGVPYRDWLLVFDNARSEERRVGKEWRARGSPQQCKRRQRQESH